MKHLPGLLTGGGLAVLGGLGLLKVAPPAGTLTFALFIGAIVLGLVWALSSCSLKEGRVSSLMQVLSVNALILGLLLLLIEAGGRAVKIDFNALNGSQAAKKREAYPPWTHEPDQPLPEVFFLHPGPVTWTGQPLRTLEVLRLGTDNAYVDESAITVDYDADGFRNAPGLKDWEVVVVGDSYTELGYLPDQELTSSVVARQTGLRVKNLGVCDTGLLAYARFLKNFGAAPSARQVVFVMFEGNDVQDTTVEWSALQAFRQSGQRSYRSTVETSFLKAVAGAVSAARNRPQPRSFQNAWFASRGHELPVTISTELPVDLKNADQDQMAALKAGLAACAAEAKALGLQPLLAYVPVNNRVYDGLLRFGPDLPHEVQTWKPHDLPAQVAALCHEQGMLFVDTTPALRARAKEGLYVHNRILDCHVNVEGARIIGQVIADVLKTDTRRAALVHSGK